MPALKLLNRNWKKKSASVKWLFWLPQWLILPANPSFGEASPRSTARAGFASEQINGSNGTAQSWTLARIWALASRHPPLQQEGAGTNGLLCNDRVAVFCCKQGTRACMISIGCSGLKTNMQIFIFARFHGDCSLSRKQKIQDRVSEIDLLCSPPFWQKKGEPSTEPSVPRTLSKLIFGS